MLRVNSARDETNWSEASKYNNTRMHGNKREKMLFERAKEFLYT